LLGMPLGGECRPTPLSLDMVAPASLRNTRALSWFCQNEVKSKKVLALESDRGRELPTIEASGRTLTRSALEGVLFPALRARAGQGYTWGCATRNNKNHRKIHAKFRGRSGGGVAGTTGTLRLCLDSTGQQCEHGSSDEVAKDVTWEVSPGFPTSLH
jgi:hypothetical protein